MTSPWVLYFYIVGKSQLSGITDFIDLKDFPFAGDFQKKKVGCIIFSRVALLPYSVCLRKKSIPENQESPEVLLAKRRSISLNLVKIVAVW